MDWHGPQTASSRSSRRMRAGGGRCRFPAAGADFQRLVRWRGSHGAVNMDRRAMRGRVHLASVRLRHDMDPHPIFPAPGAPAVTGAELADELSTIADAYCADTREAWRMARFVNANMVAILAALRAERPEPAVGDVEAVAIEDDCEPFDPANPKLKPCPFCGAEAELVEIDDMTDADCGGNFVACKACEASTNLRFSAGDDARPLVCEQWNRRAALAQGQTGDER